MKRLAFYSLLIVITGASIALLHMQSRDCGLEPVTTCEVLKNLDWLK